MSIALMPADRAFTDEPDADVLVTATPDFVCSDPTFTTSNATNITNTTARLNGMISDLTCEQADDTFWEWGLSTGNYTSNYTDTTNRGNVAVYHNISGLTENTTYYFRGAARLNGEAWQYGSELYFTTTNITTCSIPTGLTVTALTDTHILAEWDNAGNVTGYLLLVSNTVYPNDPASSYAIAYNGSDTSVTLSGYNLDFTEYFFSLWTYCNPYSDDYDTASIGGETMEGISNSLIFLIEMVFLIFFSVIAFWRDNSVMFGLAAGVAVAVGFSCYDLQSSPFMFGIALVLWAYSIACLIFGLMCMFKRRPVY